MSSDYLSIHKDISLYFQTIQIMGVKHSVPYWRKSIWGLVLSNLRNWDFPITYTFYMDIFLQKLHRMTLLAASLLSSDRLYLSWHNGCAAAFFHNVKFRQVRSNLVTASVLPGKVFLRSTAAGTHAVVSFREWLEGSGNN